MAIDFTAWPASLPNPQISSHKITQPLHIDETDMADGSTIARNTLQQRELTIPVTFLLTAEQEEVFDGVIENILSGGARWFQFPILMYGRVTHMACRFTKQTSRSYPRHNLCKLTATLKVRKIPIIDENTTVSSMLGVDDVAQQTVDSVDAAVTDYVTPN